jgi:hypothetical protein
VKINALEFATQFATHIDTTLGRPLLQPLLTQAGGAGGNRVLTADIVRAFESAVGSTLAHVEAIRNEGLLDDLSSTFDTPITAAGHVIRIFEFMTEELVGKEVGHWKTCRGCSNAIERLGAAFFQELLGVPVKAASRDLSGDMFEFLLLDVTSGFPGSRRSSGVPFTALFPELDPLMRQVRRSSGSPFDLLSAMFEGVPSRRATSVSEHQARWGALMAVPKKLRLVLRYMDERVPEHLQEMWLADVILSPQMGAWEKTLDEAELTALLGQIPLPSPERIRREEHQRQRSHEHV